MVILILVFAVLENPELKIYLFETFIQMLGFLQLIILLDQNFYQASSSPASYKAPSPLKFTESQS